MQYVCTGLYISIICVIMTVILISPPCMVMQMMKTRIGGRLPFPLTEEEEEQTAASSSSHASAAKISPFTKVAVVRPNVARVIVEDGNVVVYHCLDNSREIFENPISPLEFELDDGPAIEKLLGYAMDNDAAGVVVADLPHTSEELHEKVGIAEALFKEGLLRIVDDVRPSANPSTESNGDDLFKLTESTDTIDPLSATSNKKKRNDIQTDSKEMKKIKIGEDDEDCPF